MRQPWGRGHGRESRGSRGSGDGRKRRYESPPPPSEVVEVATFLHACEEKAVLKPKNEKIPNFNAEIYLGNKVRIGKVHEIFGPINESCFSVEMKKGIIAASYKPGDKFYIDPAKLVPFTRFLPQPKGQARRGGRGGGRGSFLARGRGRGGRRGGGHGGFQGRDGARGGGRDGPRGGRGGGGFRGRSRC